MRSALVKGTNSGCSPLFSIVTLASIELNLKVSLTRGRWLKYIHVCMYVFITVPAHK